MKHVERLRVGYHLIVSRLATFERSYVVTILKNHIKRYYNIGHIDQIF